MGYTLHPSIKRKLPPNATIAELATGTGAFLLDVLSEIPSASQLDGYDISKQAFLAPESLPKNVSLSVTDARQPAPSELHGKYDVVAIRFLNAALIPEDWKEVASHASQLLKKGGALQWIEGDLLQLMTVLRLEPEVKLSALEKGLHQALSKQQQLRWFIPNLHAVLTEVGFTNIKHDITSTDRIAEGRQEMGSVGVGAIYSILLHQAHSGIEGMPTEEEVEEMRNEMLEEIEGGAYCRCDMHQFIAWKA